MITSEAFGKDHQYLDECYENLKAAKDLDDKIKWRNMLTWNLARHAISEELTVYPAMEKWMGEEGKAPTKDDFSQHQTVQNDLYIILHSLSPSVPKLEELPRRKVTLTPQAHKF